jgi:hypothetical protein
MTEHAERGEIKEQTEYFRLVSVCSFISPLVDQHLFKILAFTKAAKVQNQ